MPSDSKGPLHIDLKKVLRTRLPKKVSRWIPTPLISSLEHLVRQDDLNDILEKCYPKQGSEFAQGVLDYLDVSLDVQGLDNIPKEGRFIFVSNHPLGGLDGIALISVLGKIYGDENVRFLVNDMLMNVEPLRNVFLPINKYGSQAREATTIINDVYRSDKQILIFPAGLVSRKGADGTIRDLKWQKTFVAKAIRYERDIIPIHFEGLNSMRFYRAAKWRKKLGVKFNIEQILLPAEVMRSRTKHFVIKIGKPISYQQLAESGKSLPLMAEAIKKIVYSL